MPTTWSRVSRLIGGSLRHVGGSACKRTGVWSEFSLGCSGERGGEKGRGWRGVCVCEREEGGRGEIKLTITRGEQALFVQTRRRQMASSNKYSTLTGFPCSSSGSCPAASTPTRFWAGHMITGKQTRRLRRQGGGVRRRKRADGVLSAHTHTRALRDGVA